MRKHFAELKLEKFKIYAFIIFLINDSYNWITIYLKYSNVDNFYKTIKNSIKLTGQQIDMTRFGDDFFNQLFSLFVNWLIVGLVFLFIFHFIMYVLFYKGKRSAYMYLISVGIVAGFSFLLIPLNNISNFNLNSLIQLTQAITYLYATIGLFKFLPENKVKKKLQRNDNNQG